MTIERKNQASGLRSLLKDVTAKHKLPGLAVAIRTADHVVIADGFGTYDAEGLQPVTADTMFGVASVTKFLTAILIMQAQSQKLLKLSDPISQFYPELDCASDGRMRLHHLLTHTAGFPGLPFRHDATIIADGRTSQAGTVGTMPEPVGAKEAGPLLTADDLVERINASTLDMLGPPGKRLSYSNEGYCLLGGVVEKLYHCSFAKAAEEYVLQPLQMDRSAIGGRKLGDKTNLAVPLMRNKAGLQPCGFWEAPLFYPVGGLISSVRDMVRLISVLNGDTEVLTRQEGLGLISMPVPVASRPSSKTKYGLGLEVEQLDADNILVWHTGQRPGISSFVGHVPQKKLSVAMVVNLAHVPTAAIGHQIISQFLHGEIEANSCLWPPAADPLVDAQVEHFCGCYGSQEMGEFHVRFHRGRLLLELESVEHELLFESPDNGTVAGHTFCFLSKDGNRSSADASTALALDLRIFPRLEGA